MAQRHVKYLLIGGGVASDAAADAIRRVDPEGKILLIAQEIVRPYQRPPLSKKFLRRQSARETLFTHDRDWFDANQIELRTGRRAATLDAQRGSLALDNGDVISYDNLLLATGMLPKHLEIPGSDLPGLYYLRTLEDALHLQKAVDKATHEGHPHASGSRNGPRGLAVIIGAGMLGVELAASLSQLGVSVDLLCAHDHPWHKFAGEIVGKGLMAYLEKMGVRVHADSRPLRIEGDGRAQRVILGDGRPVPCDFAIAAIGGISHRELLRGTPIAAEKAILTDSYCRTNVPNIYAAGDCAAIFDPLFGKHRIVDHWEHAALTGALAGRNMAGRNDSYAQVNHFFSDVLDLSLNGWGEARFVDHRIVRTARNDGGLDLIEIGVAADGRVAQVLAMGHSGDSEFLRSLVANRSRVDGLEEKIKDPAIPLCQILA